MSSHQQSVGFQMSNEFDADSVNTTQSLSNVLELQPSQSNPQYVPQREGVIMYVNDSLSPPRLIVSTYNGTTFVWKKVDLLPLSGTI